MGPRLQALLDVNRDDGAPIRPALVAANREDWIDPASVEFYVDFETVSSLDDDFSAIPERGGQELIFMIGCGHIADGEWRFECFVTNDLGEPDEARIIDEWVAHMQEVRGHLGPDLDPYVIHWSPAEETWLETAWYAAVKRHPEKNWPHPNWFDFLARVVQRQPVVVRGSHGFGLKPVTKAMHALGLVDIEWGDGPTDGLGAMIGAWWCAHEAKRLGVPMLELELMRQIRDYRGRLQGDDGATDRSGGRSTGWRPNQAHQRRLEREVPAGRGPRRCCLRLNIRAWEIAAPHGLGPGGGSRNQPAMRRVHRPRRQAPCAGGLRRRTRRPPLPARGARADGARPGRGAAAGLAPRGAGARRGRSGGLAQPRRGAGVRPPVLRRTPVSGPPSRPLRPQALRGGACSGPKTASSGQEKPGSTSSPSSASSPLIVTVA